MIVFQMYIMKIYRLNIMKYEDRIYILIIPLLNYIYYKKKKPWSTERAVAYI